MYTEHYGLQQLPFGITPDTHFFFAHSSYQEALNTLLVAARSGEGFLKVVGEVGTGKTLLCRKFLNQLETEGFVTAFIPNPYLEPMTLLLAVADELGVAYPENPNQHLLLKALTEFLITTHADGKRVALCLDEAQAMPTESLEALRLLTNLETESRKLLQVVLFGQPELDIRLDEPSIRQLKQRITFSSNLGTLNAQDVEYYLAHRLGIAGYRGARLFSREAVRRLHRASRGVPRLINILAHKALMAGFGEGARYITDHFVKLAILDTESARARSMTARRRWLRLWALLAALAASASALVWAHWL
ncbi:MAG: AAA family ATPase [Candidatus Muproteobacteria bacterium RBG_19FT_COMBO_61_10]|uniref:AAA family ATPase n=1 Tax=Candidatus Muproteobacteria bacterium RBG_19FT_COMBO_61_10 TaxID=1817761 RepID=A0A1F6UJ30_9PROT|nr:MAG: AAA family ATPase [Candidatus Muproteobacteria bacterium RBG_19FT_COMBO_61_10]